MNRIIQRLTSLIGLIRPRNRGGQIATLMILLLVTALVFVLATVNIGNVAVESTALANAADATVLQLASSLATQARQLYEGLGNRWEKCKKRGWMSLILGGLAAATLAVASWWCGGCLGWWAIPIIVAAGVVGGMVGAAIDGTSILQGAITGFKIGVAVAAIATGTGALGLEETMIGPSQLGGPGGFLVPMTPNPGLVATGVLSIASEIYLKVAEDQAISELFSQFAKSINAMNDPLDTALRYREQAFFTALNYPGVMDDPNKVADSQDIDGDGNTTEFIPAFLDLWNKRVRRIQKRQHQVYRDGGIVDWFQWRMHDFAANYKNTLKGLLRRQDYQLMVNLNGTPDDKTDDTIEVTAGAGDSKIVRLLRALEGLVDRPNGPHYWTYMTNSEGQPEEIWKSGPELGAMQYWFNDETNCDESPDPCANNACDQETLPAGYDPYDELVDDLVERVELMKELGGSSTDLESAGPWLPLFYNAQEQNTGNLSAGEECELAKTESYFYTLGKQTALLTQLKREITRIRDTQLPVCEILEDPCAFWDEVSGCVSGYPYVSNYPCRFAEDEVRGGETGSGRGSINSDLFDEFLPVVRDGAGDIDQVRNALDTFRNDIQSLVNGLAAFDVPPDLGGTNPITYCWSDTRGRSCIDVKVGPVIVPYMHHCKHRKGPRILYYSGPYPGGRYAGLDRCWVRITKTPPSALSLGSLGRWNPFSRPLTKVSVARYNHFKTHDFEVWIDKTNNLAGVQR